MMWRLMCGAAAAVAAAGSLAAQRPDPLKVQECRELVVATSAERLVYDVNVPPRFSVIVRNDGARPVRMLDIRNGRRPDLQAVYFELFVTQGGRLVSLPQTPSDPGPVTAADFFSLKPGQRELLLIRTSRTLDRLPPGDYEAFVLFWRDPLAAASTRCRSAPGPFRVLAPAPTGGRGAFP